MFARDKARVLTLFTGLWLLLGLALQCQAQGTPVGRFVVSSAQLEYRIDGVTQQLLVAAPTLVVQELLDARVQAEQAQTLQVFTPQPQVVLQFSLTNTGNGTEGFRLLADALPGADFQPAGLDIYLESNATPGLQLGAGGDTPYVPGVQDPVLVADATLTFYLVVQVPAGLTPGELGVLSVRALPLTLIAATGQHDPGQPGFPGPGSLFVGLGDPDALGNPTDALLGPAFVPDALLASAQSALQVQRPLLSLQKDSIQILDLAGGERIESGTRIQYQLEALIQAEATLTDLRLQDLLPVYLALEPDSLSLWYSPSGLAADLQHQPAPQVQFDPAQRLLTLDLDTVTGPGLFRVTYWTHVLD